MNNKFSPRYRTKACSQMTEHDCFEFSHLFSTNYGRWGHSAPEDKRGKRIKMSPQRYQSLREMEDMYVSYCQDDGIIIGSCFFLKKRLGNGRVCVWITQLVVNSSYRNLGIAKRLLQSAWGFSDYSAWGLATANSVTIKTLESVTWREVEPIEIIDHIDDIRALCDSLPYSTGSICLDANTAFINTNFPIEREKHPDIDKIYIERLGNFPEGQEWLAYTFQNQPIIFDNIRFEEMLSFSSEQLNDAYSRMDMQSQPWTKGTAKEVDDIIQIAGFKSGCTLLDVGCGQGRHSIEFANRGFDVLGIDASEINIVKAKSRIGNTAVKFKQWDARKRLTEKSFDYAICLYDVIGSYRTLEENTEIIHQLANRLRKGGRAVISVMNMQYMKLRAKLRGNVHANPQLIFQLKASTNMQERGDMFDLRYQLLDEDEHLVYHKEQFEQDGLLSAEYVVADYRFTQSELSEILVQEGFNILESRFVRAGHFKESLPEDHDNAKEILFVIEKK